MLLLLLTLLLMRYDTIEYVKKVFVNFIYRTEPKKPRKVTKRVKTKTELLRRNGLVNKSVELILRPEESLW